MDTRFLLDAARDVLAGSIAGTAGIIVGYPLDTWKVRLQTRLSRQATAGAPAQPGMRGLFRGLAAPVSSQLPVNAISFGVEASMMRWLQKQYPDWSSPWSHFVAGCVSGSAQVGFSTPAEHVKCLMQAGTVSSSSGGTLANSYTIVTQYGLRKLFRGFSATFTRDTLAFGVYFGFYDMCKTAFAARHAAPAAAPAAPAAVAVAGASTVSATDQRLATPIELARISSPPPIPSPSPSPSPSSAASLSTAELMISGGVAGVASWVLLHPIDVLKSRVQSLPLSASWADSRLSAVLARGLATDGPGFLLRGLTATCIRAFVASAVTFPVFEAMIKLIHPAVMFDHREAILKE